MSKGEKMTDEQTKPKVWLGDLDGPEGNAFSILGKCKKVLQSAGVDDQAFWDEATSDDYNQVLRTAHKWCNVQDHVLEVE
jgi:hypothetical protein